jgi:hypothetical protein
LASDGRLGGVGGALSSGPAGVSGGAGLPIASCAVTVPVFLLLCACVPRDGCGCASGRPVLAAVADGRKRRFWWTKMVEHLLLWRLLHDACGCHGKLLAQTCTAS